MPYRGHAKNDICTLQGFLLIAVAAATLISVAWFSIASGSSPAAPSSLAYTGDIALVTRALDRYAVLAKNMSLRIETAERVLQQLQRERKEGPEWRPMSSRVQQQLQRERGAVPPASGAASGGNEGSGSGGDEDSKDGSSGGSGEDGEQEPEESEEEQAKRQAEEEAEQRLLIKYDAAKRKFNRWRPDYKCGDRVPPLPDGEIVECEAGGEAPCCSALGWCGKSAAHCECDLCADYRSQVRISYKGIKLLATERECESIAYNLGEHKSPESCAATVLSQVECGRKIMFSEIYPSWGCRCCTATSGADVEVKTEWDVYDVIVSVQPAPSGGGAR